MYLKRRLASKGEVVNTTTGRHVQLCLPDASTCERLESKVERKHRNSLKHRCCLGLAMSLRNERSIEDKAIDRIVREVGEARVRANPSDQGSHPEMLNLVDDPSD